jgi:hypothetical protein
LRFLLFDFGFEEIAEAPSSSPPPPVFQSELEKKYRKTLTDKKTVVAS